MSTISRNPATPYVASHAGAEFFCQKLQELDRTFDDGGKSLLIAGCGAGHEAALIQRLLDAEVTAVDVVNELLECFREWPRLHYQVSSVCHLPFAAASFDAVFYHHVIEHVEDPPASLAELTRVLKPGGWLFIGTPNRHRLVSSVGAHRQTQWEPTLRNKLRDNLRDWTARVQGKFRNECGAHAGFSRSELSGMLQRHFQNQHWVTRQYLQYKYLKHRFSPAVSLFTRGPLQNLAAPSIYVFAQKGRD
jgi:ubiquinone/menaquinone biosynthesis C-methylase UbiE